MIFAIHNHEWMIEKTQEMMDKLTTVIKAKYGEDSQTIDLSD